jgi:hypothetical protein
MKDASVPRATVQVFNCIYQAYSEFILPCSLAAVEARRPSRERELWCSRAWKSLRTKSRKFASISRVQQLCADSHTLNDDPAIQQRTQ